MTTDLVPSVSIENLVNQRAAVIERIAQATGLLREAGALARAAHVGMPTFSIGDAYSRHGRALRVVSHDTDLDEARDELMEASRTAVDAAAWQYLMHESGLRSLMDAKARAKWDESIYKGDVPELTAANIRSTFKMLHDSRGEMFERGVIACFKSLSWNYKTNLPQKFGKRIVMKYLSGSSGHERCNQLDDIVRVMTVLDGKPEPDHRTGAYALLRSAGIDYSNRRGEAENDWLHVRTFKNGNGHVTFKRPDLVDKMNKIIAKHYPGALPAPK